MTALHVQNLTFSWPGSEEPTLSIANLSLAPGERMFLFGPSGSGKSTLLSAIAGVVDVAPGAIKVAEQDVGALHGGARDRFRADHLGIIFQVFNLIPWLSALENVLLPCTYSPRRRERAGRDPAKLHDGCWTNWAFPILLKHRNKPANSASGNSNGLPLPGP